jgi:hypothetical protein
MAIAASKLLLSYSKNVFVLILVEDDPDGGYTARALGESIFTQANDMESLLEMVRDAVHCHFPDEQRRFAWFLGKLNIDKIC